MDFKPKVYFQGEIDIMASSIRGIYLVRFPNDTEVKLYHGRFATEKAIKSWTKKNAKNAINFAISKWGKF